MRINLNLDINHEVEGNRYSFVDAGSSKEVYQLTGDSNSIYKIPRATDSIAMLNDKVKLNLYKPTTIEEVYDVLQLIEEQSPSMVWPVGQLMVEIFVWEKLLELEQKGYDISCFARLEDYYFDNKGIPVIKQEAVNHYNFSEDEWASFCDRYELISEQLEYRYDIYLNDIRRGNVGIKDKMPKIYDFGMINDYFSDYADYDSYCEDDEWEEE